MSKQKIFLNVHYLQREQVKSLGARWDSSNKKWYITDDINDLPMNEEVCHTKYGVY